MKKSILLLIIVGALLILFLLFQGVRYLSPGSYAFAEIYEFNTTDTQLINRIEDYKANNPQFKVPINNLVDGKEDSNDYWYHIYFYYPKDNEIIYFWVRQSIVGKTKIGLVSFNKGLHSGSWTEVNDNDDKIENSEVKKIFQQQVLDKLGLKYLDKGNGMSLW